MNLRIASVLFAAFLFGCKISSAALQRYESDSTGMPGFRDYSLMYSNYYSGIGYANVTHRDFATSPLFYDASAVSVNMGWPRVKEKSRREIGIEALAGISSARVPMKTEYIVISSSGIYSGNVHFDYLRKRNFPKLKSETWFGLSLQSRFNFRINSDLGNNGSGIEALANLMASGRIEKDFSKKAGEGKAFLFFKRKKDVYRMLCFQINAGFLNFNYRPGYAYSGFSEFNGSQTNGLQFLLANHSWSLNGFRINTKLEWILNKKNKYSDRWVYSWDLIHAPGKYERFQMVVHTFTYSMLLFRK
ncbi:MAG: hypothetical protein KDC13_03395 [Bacteroidetes bacterium]|nr:hypothetical protein [Bacteroidota bacterium]